jgi:hypothetical protein
VKIQLLNQNRLLKKVLEALHTNPWKYFAKNDIMLMRQLSVHWGLYWDTYHYLLQFSDNASKSIYIKIRKEGEKELASTEALELQRKIRASYENSTHLHQHFTQFSGFSSVKPVACFPEWLALVTEGSPGENVWSLLRAKAKFYPSLATLKKLEHICWACGQWLALFQRMTRAPEQDPFEFHAIITKLETYLADLAYEPPLAVPKEFRQRILTHCQRLAQSIPDQDRSVVGIHGDFAPVNILTDHSAITVIDIGAPKFGIVYWDASYFYYHLETLLELPIYRPTTVRKLQQAFLQGFGVSLEPTKHVVNLCLIHNMVNSLLYYTEHRKQVNWSRKVYDRIRYRRYIQQLCQLCHCDI